MSPGGTASAETGGELSQHKPLVPKPTVDWQRSGGNYRAPALMAHFKWPEAIVLREKLDNGEMTVDEYNRIISNAPGNPLPNVKMLITSASNPVMTHPDVNTNIKALKKLEFNAVFSYHLDNPSARYADMVIPQMHTAFEGRDVPFSRAIMRAKDLFCKEAEHLNGNYFVYKQKCVNPPGEIKPRGWVWLQIAKRLGFAEEYSPRLVNIPDDKWEETVEALHREAYEKWALLPEVAPRHPPSWEEFQKKPVYRWEVKEVNYTYKSTLERGENPFAATESGKIEFYSKEVDASSKSGKKYKSKEEKPHAANNLYGGGNLPAMAEMVIGGRATYHSNDVVKYPLLMSSPASIHCWIINRYCGTATGTRSGSAPPRPKYGELRTTILSEFLTTRPKLLCPLT
jgi:anaerobic dimethyl sulfoxide reductase subunit A